MRLRISNPSRTPRRAAGAATTALALAAGAALLAGCSTDGTTLARVGGQTITVRDYKEAAFNAGGRYEGPPDTTRARLLDDMVRRALMLEYAHTSGIVVDSLLDRFRSEVEKEALAGALGGLLVPRTVPVSEAEVRALHAWRDSSTRCQVIYTPDRPMIDAARAALDQGADFAATADRFNPAGLLPPGGDFGYLLPGSLVDPIDGVMRETPVGETAGPFEATGEGWFLLRVMSRRAEVPVPIEEARPQLTQLLMQRKRRALSVAAFQNLRDTYHLRVEPDAAQLLLGFVKPPGLPAFVPAPDPTPAERARALARWDGGPGLEGAYTLGDAFDDLDSNLQDRPNPFMLSSFRPWIESRAMQRLVLAEAGRRKLLDEPDVARQVRDRVDNYLLEAVYTDAVMLRAQPGEEDVRAAWAGFDDPNKGPFESMSEDLRRHLESETFRIASERRLIAFTDSLRQAVPVRIDTRLLRRMPRPSTALFQG